MNRKIKKVGVIGSGVMGSGIAALIAGAGIKTLLLDIVPSDLSDNDKKNRVVRNRIVKSGLDAALGAKPSPFMIKDDAQLIEIGNLEDDFYKLAACDWICEVVVEKPDIKRNLFKNIDTIRKPGSIISSNTSGIPLSLISKGLSNDFKTHFMGTHFFNPVRYMHLLELIKGKETLSEVFEFMKDFGQRILGKGVVQAKDTPNFIGNRVGLYTVAKTLHIMEQQGFSISETDALFGTALGRPKTAVFKTIDIVGLDVFSYVADNMRRALIKDDEKQVFNLPCFINSMIEKNLLGKKVKSGFYKTELSPDWKIIRKVINLNSLEYEDLKKPNFPCLEKAQKAKTLHEKVVCMINGDDKGSAFVWQVVASSLIYAANQVSKIADSIVEIDNAMKWGFNYEIGLFELWDVIGLKESVLRMEKHGFDVPEKIYNMISLGNDCFYKIGEYALLYYDFDSNSYKKIERRKRDISLNYLKQKSKQALQCKSASLIDLDDGVFCLEFHTKMNSLNKEIIDFMGDSIDYVDSNGVGLVIGNQSSGMPGAFSAGADLAFLSKLICAKEFEQIDNFIQQVQETVQMARYYPFPIIAAPYGITLGGGCELCLGLADKIVAHADLYMGLVEIGVGLLPSGGGCLNLWKKFINALPGSLKDDFDMAKLFAPVFMNIAMAKVSNSAADAKHIGYIGDRDRIVFNKDHLIGEAKKEILKIIDEGYQVPVKKPLKVMGQAAQGVINVELFNYLNANFVTEYDVFLAKRIAYVLSGGEARDNGLIDEDTILQLEREAFVDFCKQEKTLARIDHMLKTGKPLRN